MRTHRDIAAPASTVERLAFTSLLMDLRSTQIVDARLSRWGSVPWTDAGERQR